LSVSDKTGIVELARALVGVELLASGGTARALQEAGVAFVTVAAYTGAPEVLGGRVKTLHPKIHAGILADRRNPDHLRDLAAHGYAPIDLVVCNLYPFAEQLAAGSDRATLIETIDVGGPTLIRAAAKNCDGGVTVLTDPRQYAPFLAGNLQPEALATSAFAHVAAYDQAIATWMAAAADEPALPSALGPFYRRGALRYGENPHQMAALYTAATTGLLAGTQLCGKALSYNNYLDLDAARRCAGNGSTPRCTIVKHTNPCGLAEATTQRQAFLDALAGDPISAFGSILGFNQPLEAEVAQAILDAQLFVECIVAPGFRDGARGLLEGRKNLRLYAAPLPGEGRYHMHAIDGGLLVQATDTLAPQMKLVTKRALEPGWRESLRFAFEAAGHLKSNAIAVTRGTTLVGAGAGQMSRVDAMRQALTKAGGQCGGAFVGSDAFFPFADCVHLAADAGIAAIIQPGGSVRDAESVAACDARGLAMVVTGERHFRH
jgi:phosphoribosylaminoimidazolecarboxamide formyltransferase/IMP cyclohydrolase